MPAQEHPAEADEALARHERRVAGLVRGLAAADPREPPAVVRTHISTVILAGETAYKLKRPVRLPFLDFSLLSQRRFFLDEELRINRRTAPQLYLDVLPVTGPIEQPVIGGDGEPADWLLRMHRFEAEGEFAAMAHAGLLRAQHVEALAEHIAAFHGGLAPLTTEPPGGLPPKDARQWTLENLDEIAVHPLRPAGCAAAEVAALRRDLDRAFDRAQGLIDRRRAQGFVRECHGDLHLGNVVLWRGEVLAFDAIEFDARLRCIDIVSDVAFTFMDLLAKGLRPLAWRFINTWAARTGDYEGLTLLRLYAAYRALVRAKVALLSGGDAQAFATDWTLAKDLARGPSRPRLVVTMGLSGSGKSTVARQLADELGAVWLRSDVERKRLHGLAPAERAAAGSALYSAEATRRTYARLGELAETLLAAGLPVVVDAACLRRHEREALRALAERLGVAFSLVACSAEPGRLRERILARQQAGTDPSDATPEVLALQQRVQEPLTPDERRHAVQVANGGPLQALEAQVARLAAAWAPAQGV